MKLFSADYWREHLPIRKALLWIATITCLISGSAAVALFYSRYLQEQRTHDPQYAISSIIQTCEKGPRLPNLYLTELLALATDYPSNLFQWNASEGERLLQNSPLIIKASVQKIAPNTVCVHYATRTPVARLADYSGTLIDSEGFFIPDAPFLESAKLPLLYLGCRKACWGEKAAGVQTELALVLLRLIKNSFPDKLLASLDVSQAYALSLGKRQVVAVFGAEREAHFLRVTAEGYLQQLANYRMLLETRQISEKQGVVVDLRLDHLAYLNPLGET